MVGMATSGCSSSVLSVMASQSGTPIKSDTSSTASLLLWVGTPSHGQRLGLVRGNDIYLSVLVRRFGVPWASALGINDLSFHLGAQLVASLDHV